MVGMLWRVVWGGMLLYRVSGCGGCAEMRYGVSGGSIGDVEVCVLIVVVTVVVMVVQVLRDRCGKGRSWESSGVMYVSEQTCVLLNG